MLITEGYVVNRVSQCVRLQQYSFHSEHNTGQFYVYCSEI